MNQNQILFLTANPTDTTRLHLDRESRLIDLALQNSRYREKYKIHMHGAVRISDLQPLLLRHRPTIVHFSGHGSPQGEIILEDDYGNAKVVSIQAISKLFSLLSDTIKCVVLNACFSELQAESIAHSIDYVIGLSNSMTDDSAIKFASSFYRALAEGIDIPNAFEMGCVEIHLHGLNEENVPKLVAKKSRSHTEMAEVLKSVPKLPMILDVAGFPMIWVPPQNAYIHWLPVTKIQFETFLVASGSSKYDSVWYDELLRLNPRVSSQDITKGNYWGAILTGIKPSETYDFMSWCGADFSMPTLEEWNDVYKYFKTMSPIPIDEVINQAGIMSPRTKQLLRNLDEATINTSKFYEVKERTLADQMLMRLGVMEWIQIPIRITGWGGIGQTAPEFYTAFCTPEHGIASRPSDPEGTRLKSYGFRLLFKPNLS
jgi:hypothetical protein